MGYGYDYCSVRKSGIVKGDSYLVKLGTVGAVVSLMFFFIGLAGLSGGLVVNVEETPVMITASDSMMMDISFPLEQLLTALVVFPVLAGFEFFGEVRENGGV